MLNLDIDNNTILYLKGDSFEDSSFYKNSILNNGVTINNDGKFYGCYDFTKTYTSMTTSGGVRLPQNEFTIEWWEKNIPNTIATRANSFINYLPIEGGVNTFSFFIGKSASEDIPRIWISSDNTSWDAVVKAVAIGNPCLYQWTHRAVIYDGVNIKCYENGKLFVNIDLQGKTIYPLDNEIRFNAMRSWEDSYSAYVDEIKIHNIVKWTTDFTPPLRQYTPIKELAEDTNLIDIVERIKLLNEVSQEEKNMLKNNLVKKGIECSEDDKMPNLIDKVDNIDIGKKIAMGEAYLTSGTYSVAYSSSSGWNEQCYCIEVDGLDFLPSKIYTYSKSSGTHYAVYSGTITNGLKMGEFKFKGTDDAKVFAFINNMYVSENGFRVPIISKTYKSNVDSLINWIAIE